MPKLLQQGGTTKKEFDISDTVGTDFICVIVLRKDGEMDVYKREDGLPFYEDEARDIPSCCLPGAAMESKSCDNHTVKISSFTSSVGSPGCYWFNGRLWY